MSKTQEELQRFKDIVSAQPDDQRKLFVSRFKELSPDKKDMAISRVLSQSPAERVNVRDANIVGQQGVVPTGGGLGEREGGIGKAKSAAVGFLRENAANAGQFVVGIGGGLAGGAFGKSPAAVSAGRAIGSAGGGIAGRAAGLAGESLLRGQGLPERKAFLKDIKETAKTEAIFGLIGGVGGHLLSRGGVKVEEGLLKKRVAQRIQERGPRTILDPKFQKGRVPKQIALKTNKFFDKVIRVSGKQVDDAINAPNVKNKALDYNSIRREIQEALKGVQIADFEGSKQQIRNLDRIIKLVEGRASRTITPPELWAIRKKIDKIRYSNSFKEEGQALIAKIRSAVNKPLQNLDDDVVRIKFQNYNTVRRSEEELGKTFDVQIFDEDTFAEKLEVFAKNLLEPGKDDRIRKLKALDGLLKADDKVIDELLDLAAAESLDQPAGFAGLLGRLVFEFVGGKKTVIGTGKNLRSIPFRRAKESIGRGIVISSREEE